MLMNTISCEPKKTTGIGLIKLKQTTPLHNNDRDSRFLQFRSNTVRSVSMELQPSIVKNQNKVGGTAEADEMRVSDSNGDDDDDVIIEELSDSDCCIVMQKSSGGERELKVNLIDVDNVDGSVENTTKKFKDSPT